MKATSMTDFKIGDIIYNTWGWEQTNIDYYQVTHTTDKTIRMRPIRGRIEDTGGMSGYSYPMAEQFTGDEVVKRPKITPYGLIIPFKYGGGGLMTERKMACSWYG